MHTIEIIVGPGGDTTISVKGIAGKGCRAVTRDLEQELGIVTSDVETAEAHATATATTTVKGSA